MLGAASLSRGNLEGALQARGAWDDPSKRRLPGAAGCWAQESARRPSASRWGQGRIPLTHLLTQQEWREGWRLVCGSE